MCIRDRVNPLDTIVGQTDTKFKETVEEIDVYKRQHVQIQSRVNGELRQDSNTRLLIVDIDHIVSELSQGMTLKAGTIIATGTVH